MNDCMWVGLAVIIVIGLIMVILGLAAAAGRGDRGFR